MFGFLVLRLRGTTAVEPSLLVEPNTGISGTKYQSVRTVRQMYTTKNAPFGVDSGVYSFNGVSWPIIAKIFCFARHSCVSIEY